MKRIGITQRCDFYPSRNEERDAIDVLWPSLLWELGFITIPVCSSIPNINAYLQALDLDGFILSGGNNIGEYPTRDILESTILELSIKQSLPVMGVCRGMQFMNHFLGGRLTEVKGHNSTVHESLLGVWAEKAGIKRVNSFHNFAISLEGLGSNLIPLAETPDGVIEAMKHRHYPWLGVMWHPERHPQSSASNKLIQNHFGNL